MPTVTARDRIDRMMIKLRSQGMTLKAIGTELGISTTQVWHFLKEAGFSTKRKPQGPRDPKRSRAIIAMRSQGMTLRAIAAEFGITHTRVGQLLAEAGIAQKRNALTAAPRVGDIAPRERAPVDWTPKLIARLRLEWDRGASTFEIGRRLGISKNAVIGKADRLDLTPRVPGRPRKSPKN